MKKEFLTKTYLVCNSHLLNELKKINGFTINLGHKLLDDRQNYMPVDVNIQTHQMFFNQSIQMLGFLGSLQIYTSYSHNIKKISIINEKNKVDVDLDNGKTLYQSINDGLLIIGEITGNYVKTTNPEPSINITKVEEYIKPNKPLNEMTLEERIAFTRNRT